jgi:hypothetical protein
MMLLAPAPIPGAAAAPDDAGRVVRAADFVNTIGVQVHLNYNDKWGKPNSPYANISHVEKALAYLNPDGAGIRILRETPFYARGGGYLTALQRLGRLGYRWNLYIGYDPAHTNLADQFAIIDQLIEAGQVALVEGPLEVDSPAWGMDATKVRYRTSDGRTHTGWAAAIAMQRDLYDRFRGRAPVALWSLAEPGNGAANSDAVAAARRMGTSVAALADWGNVHFYQHHGASPGNAELGELRRTIREETGYTAGKPFAITEAGFNDFKAPGLEYLGTPEVNAPYTLNLMLDSFKAGSALTVLYQLFDEDMGYKGDSAYQDHWGLFTPNGTPKPAATAVHNLMRIIGDTAPAARSFRTTPAGITVTGLPRGGDSLVLQKADGTTLVVIWSNANLFTDGRPVAPATSNVTVDFGRNVANVRLYDPVNGAAPVQTTRDVATLEVSLGARPMVIGLSGAGAASSRSP